MAFDLGACPVTPVTAEPGRTAAHGRPEPPFTAAPRPL